MRLITSSTLVRFQSLLPIFSYKHMSELTGEELNQIRRRNFGEYVVSTPGLGPFDAFRMVDGVDQNPDIADWVKDMFTSKQLGFFTEKTPASVGKYWLKTSGPPVLMQQGDWFVKVCDDPLTINRYPDAIFQIMFGAKEVLAPNGVEEPMTRVIELYSPSAEAATLSGEIAAYMETSYKDWMSKAYYHYMEIIKDMLIRGPILDRIKPIQEYTDKLEAKGGQITKAKYFKLLKRGMQMLNPDVN